MTTVATLRRPATALGAILAALTLSGPALGQTVLGGVGSTVETTTAAVEPVTEAVGDAASQVTAPVTTSQPTQTTAPVADAETRAAGPVGSTASAAVEPVQAATGSAVETAKGAADTATTTVTRTARSVSSRAEQTVARVATDTLTATLETATTALPSTTQALLGPLVETIDARAEELLGSPLPLGATIAGAGLVPEVFATGWATPGEAPARSVLGRPSLADDVGRTGSSPDVIQPSPAWSPASGGGIPAGSARDPGPPVAPGSSGGPAAPFSAFGSGAGFSAALAVLAGMLAFALAASLGRLMPWSDTVRPLAFISPPDRPG